MRWPDALAALLDHVEADADLVALLGGPHVYHTPDIREYHVPMVGYTVLFFDEAEVYEPFAVQWDVVASPDRVHAIAARLKRRVSAGTPRTVGGMQLRMLFEGGRTHEQPQIGVQRLSFDVRYEPLRSKYQR
jgi:hypothetical protein